VVETPLHFKAVRVTLHPGGKSSLSAANGILYQLSGSTEISLGGENKVLGAGEALFVAAGKTVAERRERRALDLALLPTCPGR
jgi:quercetin dioxygenase-like cupin family protein